MSLVTQDMGASEGQGAWERLQFRSAIGFWAFSPVGSQSSQNESERSKWLQFSAGSPPCTDQWLGCKVGDVDSKEDMTAQPNSETKQTAVLRSSAKGLQRRQIRVHKMKKAPPHGASAQHATHREAHESARSRVARSNETGRWSKQHRSACQVPLGQSPLLR